MMTVGGISASQSPSTICYSPIQSRTQTSSWCSSVVIPRLSPQQNRRLSSSSYLKLKVSRFGGLLPNSIFRCNSSAGGAGGPGPGEGDSRSVFDAFFLGKALAEALNERIESSVGEFLSTLGRLQAEQQKQVQEFQEDVLERAKRAKEKAAREAMEAQGLIPKSSTTDVPVVIDGDTTTNLPSATDSETPAISPYSSSLSTPNIDTNEDTDPTDDNPPLGVSNED